MIRNYGFAISMPKHSIKSEKREASNQKRLVALDQKKALARKSKICIDSSGKASAAQHIVFSSSGDSDNEAHTDKGTVRRTLFHSDSEDSVPEEDLFVSKRQFEGKPGEKLFRLQQKIGVDRRFQLDDRFLESGSESDDVSEQDHSGSGDDLTAQLQQEKSQALSIIDSILGSSKLRTSTPADLKHNRNVLPSRYDPTSSKCAALEQPVSPKVTDVLVLSEESDQEKEAETVPEVASERFFSVSGDLKRLFSGDTKGQAFTFLAREDSSELEGAESNSESEQSVQKQTEATMRLKPQWLHGIVDSADSSRQHTLEDHTGDIPANDKRSSRVLLFFHSKDQQLCNRLEENSFHREQPLRELEAGWAERRAGLKQAYKRRHKEAVKLARKRSKHRHVIA